MGKAESSRSGNLWEEADKICGHLSLVPFPSPLQSEPHEQCNLSIKHVDKLKLEESMDIAWPCCDQPVQGDAGAVAWPLILLCCCAPFLLLRPSPRSSPGSASRGCPGPTPVPLAQLTGGSAPVSASLLCPPAVSG